MNKPFLRLVAEDIKQRFGNDLSEIAIVFNNKRPITYLKKYLAEVYQQAIWSPQFFTIQEFLKQSTDKAEASALSQFFYLYELHNELLRQEGRDPETLEDFYPIAEVILSDFNQLDYELVDIDRIFMELYDTTRIDLEFQHFTKEQQDFIRQFWQSFSIAGHTGIQQRFLKLWKRLPVLYKQFKEKLATERQTNYATIYRELAEGNADHPAFAHQYKSILFVGFNALNRVEVKLFKNWQDEGLANFYFDTDAYYMDDNMQEAGLFLRRNIQISGLINALGEPPALLGSRTTPIHVYASSGKVSETKLLHQILEQNEQAGKSSAILLADESLLVSLLQSLPSIQVNITTGFPLVQSPIFGLLDLWLDVQEEISHRNKTRLPYQMAETFISHPLTKVSRQEKAAIQKEVTDKQLFEIDLDLLRVPSSTLPHFFKPLTHSRDLIPTLIHMLESLLGSNTDQGIDLQIDSTLLFETRRVLFQLASGFEKIGPLNISFQIGLIRKTIAPITAAIEGDPLKGVQIMGLLESRCLNFDNIYILGANEGILPKTSDSPTFLPNNLRRAYGLPILENQDALSAYLFYRHFQYSEGIHLFYNSIVDESSTGEESRFIKQLEFESQFQFIKHIQQQTILFPPTEDELIIHKKDHIWEALYNKYIRDKHAISATALTTYLQSPLQFFMKHVAEIKEPPSISQEFEMNKLGTVIHNVMEHILQPFKGISTFTTTQKLKESLDIIPSLVVHEIGKQYQADFSSITELNSLQRIMHKIASEYVRMYIQHDMDYYKAFRIIELENDEDYIIDFPISINGRDEIIKLYGIIDRVDEVVTQDDEIKTRIVDYKTGADKVLFKKRQNKDDEESAHNVFALMDDYSGTMNKALIQTLFYAYVFEQKSKRNQLEPHLYVARRMREDGTLFLGKEGGPLEGDYLQEQKEEFVVFLRRVLEEIFNPEISFRHHADTKIYDSDPYTLFYRNAVSDRDQGAEE